MIVWLNGTHGAGKTTTSALVQQLIPDSRVVDTTHLTAPEVALHIAEAVKS